MTRMSSLKDRLRADLTTAMKARDELRSSTLRMVLAAVTNAEVAGKTAKTLSDDEVIGVLTSETKKRREAATAFADGGRAESAERERAEAEVIAVYLPEQLDVMRMRCEAPADMLARVAAAIKFDLRNYVSEFGGS